jgi:hypothetical protein
VGYLASDRNEVTALFHQIHQVRVLGIFDLVKTFHAGVVWVASGKHHVPGRVAIANLHVGIFVSQTTGRESIDVGRCVGQLAPERSNRIAAHIVNGDDQNVGFVGGSEIRKDRETSNQQHVQRLESVHDGFLPAQIMSRSFARSV